MGRPKASKYRGKDTQLLQRIKEAATLLRHVSETTRLNIILILANREMHISELCLELDTNKPPVNYHLELLTYAGIIDARRKGPRTVYSLTEKGDLLAEVINKIIG
jgi:DNA-binding transcriptional ArsR family regulator